MLLLLPMLLLHPECCWFDNVHVTLSMIAAGELQPVLQLLALAALMALMSSCN
jgi:hypothetical protein